MRFPHGYVISSDLLFFVYEIREKHQSYDPTVQKPFDQFQCKFDFVQLERVFFAHAKACNPNLSNMSMRFPRGLVSFCTTDLFFLYVNCVKNIIFTSLPFKNHLINSVANLILYNLRGSSLRMIRLKVLTQETCP
jgi:hypothetical protein